MKHPDRLSLAREFIAGREDLQPIPFLVHILRAFIKADLCLDLRPVIDAIEREPTIAARVIAHAQSAAYHSIRPALSVSDAVNKMGLDNARRVILALALKEANDFGRCPAFDVKRFMIDTIRVAHIASIIGQPIVMALPRDSADAEALSIPPAGWYCIGLLHNIGLLHMVEREPGGMNLLLSDTDSDGLIQAERSMLGFDHFDVSTVLLAGWGLPSPFYAALPYLDHPSYRGLLWPVAAVVDLARCLASVARGNDQTGDSDPFPEVADEWAKQWGVVLPAPLPISSAMMDEATALMEAVL